MRYCSKCLYPENAKPYIIFDDEGVCSGCRTSEQYDVANWIEREKILKDILSEYKIKAEKNKSHYDCIIPVSGGKDSHYQAHLIKNKYGLNPLFVTYNHVFNAPLGLRNLTNIVNKFNCDIIRFTTNPESVRKISRYMLKRCGDMTWHYHSGILTFPIQIAVKFKIPLIIWAENNFYYNVGTFNPDDMVEFSRKHRKDFGLRGIEAEEMVGKDGIEWKDIAPFVYPGDDEMESVGVRGIYLSNFVLWDDKKQAEMMHQMYDFQPARGPRERTFNLYAKLDDYHANGAHDYLKFLKFGYGRATDDASIMIRKGRMTREEGIELVKKYDHARPRDLDIWLRFVGMSEKEFFNYVDSLRDTSIWEKAENGEWVMKDSVVNHVNDPNVDKVRRSLINNEKDFIEGRYPMEDPRWLLDYDGYVIM